MLICDVIAQKKTWEILRIRDKYSSEYTYRFDNSTESNTKASHFPFRHKHINERTVKRKNFPNQKLDGIISSPMGWLSEKDMAYTKVRSGTSTITSYTLLSVFVSCSTRL